MDSEDERELAGDKRHSLGLDTNLWDKSYVCLRVIEYEEREYLRSNKARLMMSSYQHDMAEEIRATCRSARFWASLEGFYTGDLDLKGRHERRYKSLMVKWNDISAELEGVKRAMLAVRPRWFFATPSPSETPLEESSTISTADLQAMCDTFHTKWKMTKNLDDLQVMLEAKYHMTVMLESKEPRFQRLLLQHLPSELIHHIVGLLTPEDARNFGATCRKFHDIGLSCSYKTLIVALPYPPGDLRPEDITRQYVRRMAEVSRERFKEHIGFLLQQPEHMRRVDRLTLRNNFGAIFWECAGYDTTTSRKYKEFSRLVSEHAIKLISQTTRTRTLDLEMIHITAPLARCILLLDNLRHIILRGCHIIPHNTQAQFSPSTTITHLTLRYTAGPLQSTWPILTEILSLRWLEFTREKTAVHDLFKLPGKTALTRAFRTLERVYLMNLYPAEADILCEVIRDAALETPLRLTHFKLELRYGINSSQSALLLAALSSAPLQHLVLEGLTHLSQQFFRSLSSMFPDLISLVIVYRDSTRQIVTKGTRWDVQLGEIAPEFAGFARLKYFAGNVGLNNQATPAIMPYFEKGWPASPINPNDELTYDIDDWACIPKLFAAYCPTLETVALIQRPSPWSPLDYTIRRTSTGEIKCEMPLVTGGVDAHMAMVLNHVLNPYNPDMANNSWPKFY
ncbi:hypothetical protein BC629DRAFT_1725378 [Irpex lacteus]|nr:hypothetical protein BC629DRAFT_1725378 [Irpex lacteus]